MKTRPLVTKICNNFIYNTKKYICMNILNDIPHILQRILKLLKSYYKLQNLQYSRMYRSNLFNYI